MSTERPILFSAPMVRAILAGQKTQTRRVVRVPARGAFALLDDGDGWWPYQSDDGESVLCKDGNEYPMPCPFGVPGDRLWVKEAIRRDGPGVGTSHYIADGASTVADAWPWKPKALPGMYCPAGLSRITLEVTAVRVERLQEITEDDARAEGCAVREWMPPGWNVFTEDGRCYWTGQEEEPVRGVDSVRDYVRSEPMCTSARDSFRALWIGLNAKRPGCSWDANPWVWVVSFRVAEALGERKP